MPPDPGISFIQWRQGEAQLSRGEGLSSTHSGGISRRIWATEKQKLRAGWPLEGTLRSSWPQAVDDLQRELWTGGQVRTSSELVEAELGHWEVDPHTVARELGGTSPEF